MHTIDELYAYLESVYSSLNSATQILAGDLATLQAKVDALAPASAAKPLNITLSGTATP